MRKLFYISEFPILAPELDFKELILNFRERFSHIPFCWYEDVWYERRFQDAIDQWNTYKSEYSSDLFSEESKNKMQTAAIHWTKERGFLNIQIDSYEAMLIINGPVGTIPVYNQGFLENKIAQLNNEKKDTQYFNFKPYMNTNQINQPNINFGDIALGNNGINFSG